MTTKAVGRGAICDKGATPPALGSSVYSHKLTAGAIMPYFIEVETVNGPVYVESQSIIAISPNTDGTCRLKLIGGVEYVCPFIAFQLAQEIECSGDEFNGLD